MSIQNKSLIYIFHTFILAPLFFYAGFYGEASKNKNLVVTLVMYTGIFAAAYHGYQVCRKKFGSDQGETNSEIPVHINMFHVGISGVFLYLAYEYMQNNEVSCSTLGAIGGMGIIAGLYHGWKLVNV